MKNLKMYSYNGYDGRFNSNRDVLMHVNTEKKIVTVFLMCSYDEAVEKFTQAVYANGAHFRGYELVAETPVYHGEKLTMSARIP